MTDTFEKKYYWGIDCGSSEIKVIVCDEQKNILLKRKTRTLFPLIEHVKKVLCSDETSGLNPFQQKSGELKKNHKIVSTGYGRSHIKFAHDQITEIKAHFLGAEQVTGEKNDYTVIDIGGQDAKIIIVQHGKVDHFVINRKCAAGTGAYIEELAHRLELSLKDLPDIAKRHDKKLILNSYCTVFAGQEVIKILMNGERVENLIQALYASVVQRVLEMASIATEKILFSGGVMNYHPVLLELFQEKLKDKKMVIVPEAQYSGALGAALHGMEKGPSEKIYSPR